MYEHNFIWFLVYYISINIIRSSQFYFNNINNQENHVYIFWSWFEVKNFLDFEMYFLGKISVGRMEILSFETFIKLLYHLKNFTTNESNFGKRDPLLNTDANIDTGKVDILLLFYIDLANMFSILVKKLLVYQKCRYVTCFIRLANYD